jgi:hypothetical protein
MLSITWTEKTAHSVPRDTWSRANNGTLKNREETLLLDLVALRSSAISDWEKCPIVGQKNGRRQ